MATTLNIAQSTGANNVNTYNQKSIAKVIEIVFHSDLYQGRCKLYPIRNRKAAERLKAMLLKPEDWCRPELMMCCERHRTECYFTTEIMQDPDRPNRWVCVVTDPQIPLGDYMLEAPRKRGKPIYQTIQLKGKMFARDPVSGRALDESNGNPVELLADLLAGDGISLEESLYNLCSYRYAKSIGAMRERDMEKVAHGEETESGFKTALGIAHSSQEMVANLIGIVKLDFPFYNNLKKLEKFLAGDKGRFTKQIMSLWQKSGLSKSVLDYSGNTLNPNIDGLLVFVDDDGKFKRLSGLGIIEENYIQGYRDALGREKVAGKYTFEELSDGIEMIGACLGMLDNVIETVKMIAEFDKAWRAWLHMQQALMEISGNMASLPDGPWQTHGAGCCSRGDLTVLENLKMVADNAAAEAQEAGWAWFLKMAPQALGFIEAGEVFKEIIPKGAQTGYKAAKAIGTKVDQLVRSNMAAVYEKQIVTKWHDLNAWIANENALMHHAIGMSVRYQDVQSIALQFYVRAKVLYGLKRLIDMCGPIRNTERRISKYNFIQSWLTTGKTFNEAVDELEVGRYIDELCLSECFWVRKDHLTVDWLHHWLQERDPAHRNEVIRTKEPDNENAWFKVQFQRYWPIHHRDIADVHKFAERFCTDWSSVDDADVDTCYLERARSCWEPVRGDKTGTLKILKITEWVLLEDSQVIDSETPVRAVLVFKKDAPVCPGTPVTFQIERTDWLNVPGPVYSTVVRPLTPPAAVTQGCIEKDPSLEKYRDRLGAIASFSYSYQWKKDKDGASEPAKVYYGLKPMIETSEWKDCLSATGFFRHQWVQARNSKQWLFPSTMDFAVKYSVANGEVDGYVKTKGRFWNSTTEITVQPDWTTGPKDPEFNVRNAAKFRDLEFLQRQVPEAPPPKPVYPGVERVVLQYFDQDRDKWQQVTGAGISTADPVRIVFVFKAKATRVPVVVSVRRTDGFNVRGPHYTRNVVSQLDDLGPEFQGKWGIVITPWYYLMMWQRLRADEIFVDVQNDGKVWRGIKPITSDEVCTWKGGAVTPANWKGYTFSIFYGVGTDDPEEANEVVKIPGALFNDVPLQVRDDINGEVPTLGHGVYGISTKQTVMWNGATFCLSTMPFIALVYSADRDGHLTAVDPPPDQFWAYLNAVRRNPDLYDFMNAG